MAGFPEETNLHMDRAEYENSVIVANGKEIEDIAIPPIPIEEIDPETGQNMVVEQDDPIFDLDDHYMHVQVHDQLIFSREFKALGKEVQMLAILHRQYHAQKLAEQVQAEATMNMAQGQAQSVREQVMSEEQGGGEESPGAMPGPGA